MIGLVIDNFAGGGGASTGIESALGRAVDVAINHDPEAVAMHAANHPHTAHYCQSVWRADPQEVVATAGGGPVALVWLSPDCKHFSRAKGGRPVEKNIRDLAWVAPLWAKRVRPRVLILENVKEFCTWGPLTADGQPDKALAGTEFARWKRELKRAGYHVEHRVLRACDHGAPTSRERLFLIARCDGLPIVWPRPTHGKPGTPDVEAGRLKPWRTAAEIIDWSIDCPSIFTRVRPLKEATNRRIAHGVMRFVVNAARPFIVPITHSGSDTRVHDLHDPLRTTTTAARGEFALISPTLVTVGYGEREGQAPRVPHLDKPLGAAVAGGAKHALVSAFLSKFSQNSIGTDAAEPLHTTMAGAPRHAVVAAHLSHFYTSNTNGGQGDLRHPAKTVTAAGQHHAVVCAHMAQHNGGVVGHAAASPLSTITHRGTQQQVVETVTVPEDALPPELMERARITAAFLIKYYGAAAHGQEADHPLDVVTSKARFGLVTVTIDGASYVLVDIGMRMLTPRELARAQGFPDSYILTPEVNGKPLTKTAQIRMIGNSVCPPMSEALVRANLPADAIEEVAA